VRGGAADAAHLPFPVFPVFLVAAHLIGTAMTLLPVVPSSLSSASIVSVVLLALTAPVRAAGNADAGLALYQARCAACHSLDHNGVGPAHRGVFGRGAALAPGFAYSDALKSSHLVWDEASLERWLADPEKLAPGQRMGVDVPDAKDRADLIAYLKKMSAAGK
jgi:cytochrome c